MKSPFTVGLISIFLGNTLSNVGKLGTTTLGKIREKEEGKKRGREMKLRS